MTDNTHEKETKSLYIYLDAKNQNDSLIPSEDMLINRSFSLTDQN